MIADTLKFPNCIPAAFREALADAARELEEATRAIDEWIPYE